jgi:ATP-dependent Clp protease protease subunit
LELKRIAGHYSSYSKIGSKEDLEKYLLRDGDTWLTPEEAVHSA